MKAFDIGAVPLDEITRFVRGLHSDPFRLLGPHRVGDDLEIRAFRPDAHGIDIVLDREPGEQSPPSALTRRASFAPPFPTRTETFHTTSESQKWTDQNSARAIRINTGP